MYRSIFVWILTLLFLPRISLAQESPWRPSEEPEFRIRVGCICQDSTRSQARGRGACAGHGGVAYWLYSEISIDQVQSQQLPVLSPGSDLVPISPGEIRRLLKNGQLIELLIGHDFELPEDLAPEPPPFSEAEEEEEEPFERKKPRPDEKSLDYPTSGGGENYYRPFLTVLAIVLVFLLILYVLRKLLNQNRNDF